MRSGPGVNYGVEATLRQGTPLELLQYVADNSNWLKVSTTSTTTQIIKGFVSNNPDQLAINLNLNELPLIYEYGPKLFEPQRFLPVNKRVEKKSFEMI
ncbi:MAG TPA: SH3 domain-containing protein, partial [Anaerolineae bacterium]|nr:SH3 domain-containing protein [Anaerolineae bacterium]